MTRQCGDCQLCCKLIPVAEIGKKANTRCQHQSHGKGCTIYARRPWSCKLWSCAWLNGAPVSRPDRSHYVIDTMRDFVTCRHNEGPHKGEVMQVPVVQVWVDPNHRDAHRDPALRAWLLEQAKQGCAALIRYSNQEAFMLLSPLMTDTHEWREVFSNVNPEAQHTQAEIAAVLRAASANP